MVKPWRGCARARHLVSAHARALALALWMHADAKKEGEGAMTVDIQSQPTPSEPRKREVTKEVAAAGVSFVEATVGAGAVTLAILGLVGILPITLAAICAIALGASLLFEGGSIRMARIYSTEQREFEPQIAGGLGAESLAGLATLVLGILALLGVEQFTLLATSLLTLGAGLLFGSTVTFRDRSYRTGSAAGSAPPMRAAMAREAFHAAYGAHAMVGIAAVALGILSLLGYAVTTLVLVGMLSVGGAMLLSGVAFGSKVLLRGAKHA
jgi:hypothetical protein